MKERTRATLAADHDFTSPSFSLSSSRRVNGVSLPNWTRTESRIERGEGRAGRGRRRLLPSLITSLLSPLSSHRSTKGCKQIMTAKPIVAADAERTVYSRNNTHAGQERERERERPALSLSRDGFLRSVPRIFHLWRTPASIHPSIRPFLPVRSAVLSVTSFSRRRAMLLFWVKRSR